MCLQTLFECVLVKSNGGRVGKVINIIGKSRRDGKKIDNNNRNNRKEKEINIDERCTEGVRCGMQCILWYYGIPIICIIDRDRY